MKLADLLLVLALVSASVFADGHDSVAVETLARTSNSWNGSPLPGYADGTPEITVLRITIAPGVTLPMHRHPVINAGVLLEGELMVVSASGESLKLTAGDSIVELVDQWHYGRNDGDRDAVIVVFYAGIAGQPITEAR